MLNEWLSDHDGEYPKRSASGEKERALSHWIISARAEYYHNRKIRLLESLPEWAWDQDEKSWQHYFSEAKAWFRDEDVTTITYPTRVSTVYAERKLAGWINEQRRHYKKREKSPAQLEHEQSLESLRVWVWRSDDLPWMRKFAELAKFLEDRGSNVENSDDDERIKLVVIGVLVTSGGYAPLLSSRVRRQSRKLLEWVDQQMHDKLYLNKKSTSVFKERLLEKLPGWVWIRRDKVWVSHYDEVSEEFCKYGGLKEKIGRLAEWVSEQKWARHGCGFRLLPLQSYEEALLESLPGWVW